MTGIERLRELAELRVVENRESVTLRAELRSIADQIEREQDKVAKTDWDTVRKVSADMADRVFMSATIDELLRDWSRKLNDATDGHVASDSHEARAPFSRMRVLAVVTDMERHVLGHEGMEDSPVARWARELRQALDGRDEEEVTDVATIRKDAYDAYEWVCENGGLDYVMHEWRSRVPRDRYERRRQRLLDHIAECETALGRRNRRIEKLGRTVEFFQLNNSNFRHLLADVAERLGFTRYGDDYEPEDLLDALDRRLMPEGMEWLLEVWPKWSNGEYCKFGDWWTADKYGDYEPRQLRRLVFYTPEQLREWEQDEGDNFGYEWDFMRPSDTTYRPDKAEPPAPKVLDADGVEIRVGDTVWHVHDLDKFTVTNPNNGENLSVICKGEDGKEYCCYPRGLTHRAPVLAADGKPLREGETVWYGNVEHTVDHIEYEGGNGSGAPNVFFADGEWAYPTLLTHERPDSLDRLAEDIGAMVVAWRSNRDLFDAQEAAAGCVGENTMGAALDSLASRAKALAERGQ